MELFFATAIESYPCFSTQTPGWSEQGFQKIVGMLFARQTNRIIQSSNISKRILKKKGVHFQHKQWSVIRRENGIFIVLNVSNG
ncbi:MAG: hypothetical protein IPN93_09250 [Bacteroidetes bacterium]|nr:hypothetical protein [Bacteroidota bacterium]